nr:MAG TPA: Fibritin C-terminal region [Caudoviricetes sp.]
MSNILIMEEIKNLLPDNNNGEITEVKLRECFNKTLSELDRKADSSQLTNKANADAANLTQEQVEAWTTKLKTISDAPSDNRQYARKNGVWEVVTASASGGGSGNVASSNVASSHLTSTNGAGMTLGANWFIDTAGFYYSIKGLSDKSADDSFDRFLVQDADGKVEQFLLNKLFSKAYDLENKVSDKAFNGYLMYNPTTKQIAFSDTAKVSTTFNVPATINVTVKNTLSSINATAPAGQQISQDLKNTIEKIKQLENIGFTTVPASDLVVRTLDRSRFPQALITKNYQLPTPFTLSDGMIVGARSNAFPAEFRNNVYMATREGEGLYSVGVNKELPTDRNWVFKFRIYNSPQVFRNDRSFGAIHFSDSLDASPRSDLANDLIIKDAWSRETVVTNNRVSSQTVINETDGFADVYLIKEGGLITLFTIMRNTGTMHMTTFTAQNTDKYIHFVTLLSSFSIADFIIKDISYNIQ